MKNLLTILFAFSWLACFGQPDSSAFLSSKYAFDFRSGSAYYLESERLNEMKPLGQWDLADYDCEHYESFSEWKIKEPTLFNNKCGMYNHDWVYAEWDDVNEINLQVTDDMPLPCGRTTYTNEARICRTCGQHQTRVKTTGWKQIPRKSEYRQLVEKFKQ